MYNSSIWPYDLKHNSSFTNIKSASNKLVAFLIMPFAPQKIQNELSENLKLCLDNVKHLFPYELETIRADDISTGSLTFKIVSYILQSDLIIVDLSRNNPNVFFEFGIASLSKPLNQVIAIWDGIGNIPTDINQIEILNYNSPNFSQLFDQRIVSFISKYPFSTIQNGDIDNLEFMYSSDKDISQFRFPNDCHVRKMDEYLEFGSILKFSDSFMTFGKNDYRNVEIKAILRFSNILPGNKDKCRIGITLRTTGFYANHSYLVRLMSNNNMCNVHNSHCDITNHLNKIEDGYTYRHEEVNEKGNFCIDDDFEFQIRIDEEKFDVEVKSIQNDYEAKKTFSITDELERILDRGRVCITSHLCFVGLKSISFKCLD